MLKTCISSVQHAKSVLQKLCFEAGSEGGEGVCVKEDSSKLRGKPGRKKNYSLKIEPETL